MRTYLLNLLLILLVLSCEKTPEARQAAFRTPFEAGGGNRTATYPELLTFYQGLAREFPEINLQTLGQTDSGEPLHLVTYNARGNFNFQKLDEDQVVLLILNGIHPGEPDGIDATTLLLRDLASGTLSAPEDVVLACIPVYNVGGALNRNSGTRANQNGPESYGFRGNSRNYDLNRDFIKMDSRNAQTFARIFHLVRPHLFLDTHVSNGADYSYTLTHLFTQHNKLGGSSGNYLETVLRPELEKRLREEEWDITPYVNVFNRPPEGGFSQFLDHPRYSTGYAALWDIPGLMVETHMLKPYEKRVQGTYELMKNLLHMASAHQDSLKTLQRSALERFTPASYYPFGWEEDSARYEILKFKGYKADTLLSEVTGKPRLKYNQDQPVTNQVRYYNRFRYTDSVSIPRAYILPGSWESIHERLDWNKISYQVLERDTTLEVTAYRIEDYRTYTRPYEGHYPHYDTQISKETRTVVFKEGDLWIPTQQQGLRYLLETLEPQAVDSFFNWNFFDTVLQRKEGFSPYVFEEVAAEMLRSDSLLRKAFEDKKAQDPNFASSAYRQLNWIFERSPHYEAAHLEYPVYRLE
ncbi:MAG: M14 family metallopeptidase [Robiginitalea sp.]|jgi:hypothetical protein